ncbi:MAG: OmpH family outer membrane protein [Kiritimatiellae bacterium]|nr:OmpH family outer membrane protein [Kiritimatiellia bacterium]MDD4735464.1 OmpH family outer membrane protein [Kiritimatiellia bacterium]
MKKNSWMVGFLLVALCAGQGAYAAQDIVTVDMDKLFNKYFKTGLADAQLKEQADEFNEERREMIEQYDAQQADFQKLREEAQNTALSEEERNKKRDEAEDLLLTVREQEQKVRRMEQQRRKQLEDQQQRMRKRIVDEINETISNYAREQNYLAVIDASGQSLNGVSVLIYSSGKLDITDEILQLLNKGAETTTEP